MSSSFIRSKGQATVELVVGVIIFIPVMLLFVDIALMVMSSMTNDSVCREAARAASKVAPIGSACQTTAQNTINKYLKGNQYAGVVGTIKLVSAIPTSDATSFMNNVPPEGGLVPGSVTVKTSVTAHPFTVLKAIESQAPITFTASQTFPFTYVAPQTSTPN